MKNHIVISSMPRPTTEKPMTLPEEKAMRRPLSRLSLAALAVRALALVAMRIPTKPASIEKMPPVRKAKGVTRKSIVPCEPKARASSSTNTTAKTLNTVVYWCLR